MRRILVVGGGIAGVEGALTLGRGLTDAHVTLLGHGPMLHVVPDLLYVPVGVSAQRSDIPVGQLLADSPVDAVLGEVESIDLDAGVAKIDSGDLSFDLLVAAPGAAAAPSTALTMHTLDDAVQVRDRIDACFEAALDDGARASIVIRAAADDAWSPPAYELALLVAERRRRLELDRVVSIALVTAEREPFSWFEPHVADTVVESLREFGVELATDVPEARFDDMTGDVVIDFGRLEARHLPGLPGRGERGWYDVDASCRIHERAFVIGDASRHGYKAAFAAAWQSRRMLLALGGSLEALGSDVGGVPADFVEHHVDLATRTLRVRIPVAASPADPWLGHMADTSIDESAPDRLAGLLVGQAIERTGGRSAARAHRALATRQGPPTPGGAPLRRASFPSP